jgi:hypothetical protein
MDFSRPWNENFLPHLMVQAKNCPSTHEAVLGTCEEAANPGCARKHSLTVHTHFFFRLQVSYNRLSEII